MNPTCRFDTPSRVADAVADWVPRSARRVLDPAVGMGNLIAPLLKISSKIRITGWDLDQQALRTARTALSHVGKQRLTLNHGDFLAAKTPSKPFDCVVMNPPFAARPNQRRSVIDEFSLPDELAFLHKGLKWLRATGRLIAILPEGVVVNGTFSRYRDYLTSKFRVVAVHELPGNTFNGTEIRSYIVIIDKNTPQWPIRLLNHSVCEPQTLPLLKRDYFEFKRLDHEFHTGRQLYADLIAATSHRYEWIALGDAAIVQRGNEDSSKPRTRGLHTTNREGLHWPFHQTPPSSVAAKGFPVIYPGDLAMQRVGRRPAETVGLYLGGHPSKMSDCIVRISPLKGMHSNDLLFVLRSLLRWPPMLRQVQLGGGAQYITTDVLAGLLIPLGLRRSCQRLRDRHFQAAISNNLAHAIEVENRIHALWNRITTH